MKQRSDIRYTPFIADRCKIHFSYNFAIESNVALLGSSQLSAEGFKGAVDGSCSIAVRGEGEGGIGEGDCLIVEGVDIVVSHVSAVLVQTSWDLLVDSGPEVVVSEIA
jgi:hypothetical protein